MLVKAASNEDGGSEEDQLEDSLSLCRDSQWPGNIGKEPIHQARGTLAPHVSPSPHLSYAFTLHSLLLLPVGVGSLVISIHCFFTFISYSPTASSRWLFLL